MYSLAYIKFYELKLSLIRILFSKILALHYFFLLSSFANLRIYPHGLVLVDVQSCSDLNEREEIEQVGKLLIFINNFY